MKYPRLRNLQISATALSPLLLFGCSDTATFATGTSIGIAASANTQQAQIGYARAELFQGPNYPDVGDAPQVVGFLGSDLALFSPHIRQLYATGDAANLVTAPPGTLLPCPASGKAEADWPPNTCAETAKDLNGERRILIFGTGTSVGLKLGFTGDTPSSINLGYDREELSVIPLHRQAPAAEYKPAAAENKVAAVGTKVAVETKPAADSKPADKYSSVLASIDLNVKTPNLLGADMQLTQFFATGAAARNLAKNNQIRKFFSDAAESTVKATTFSGTPSSQTLGKWLDPSSPKHDGCKTAVSKWMQDNNIGDSITLFTFGTVHDSQRDQAVQDATVKAACT